MKYILLPALLMANIITANVHAMIGDLSIEELGTTTGMRQAFDPLTIGQHFKANNSRIQADYDAFVKSCATKGLPLNPIEAMAEIYPQVAIYYNDLSAAQLDFLGVLESSTTDTLDETTLKFREISISDARKVYEKYGQYAAFLHEHSMKAKRLIMFLEAVYGFDSGLPSETKLVTHYEGVNNTYSDFDIDLTIQQTFLSTGSNTEWKLILSEDIRAFFTDELEHFEALIKRFDPYSSLMNRIFPIRHYSYMYRDFIENQGFVRYMTQHTDVEPTQEHIMTAMKNTVRDHYHIKFIDQIKHIEEQFRQYVKATIDRLEEERKEYGEIEQELVYDNISDDDGFGYTPDYNDGTDPMASSMMGGTPISPNLGLAGGSGGNSPTPSGQSEYDGDLDN